MAKTKHSDGENVGTIYIPISQEMADLVRGINHFLDQIRDSETVYVKIHSSPTIKDLVRYYYSLGGNEAGGLLHVLLDDGNTDNDTLLFCLNECSKANDEIGVRIVSILAGISEEERDRLYMNGWDDQQSDDN
ncbi:MAG: hypothetical protein GY927_03890 [bacterium]|nr:hypothetical protein [bacterium]